MMNKSTPSYLERPRIKAVDFGLPMKCPKAECGFGWLKLPGIKMRPCPNCGSELVSLRPRKKR
jgi:uncharacterized protein (DUF983 family)